MTSTLPDAEPVEQRGKFDATGRTVAAGRGWDWIVEAFALFRRQPGMWILIALIGGILSILVGMVPLLGSIANMLLLPIFGAGIMLGCEALNQGGTLEIDHLFTGFKQRTSDLVLVGAAGLAGWLVIALVVVAILGGGVLMGILRGGEPGAAIPIASALIAGLLVLTLSALLYMAMWFAPALIVLHRLAPLAALRASFYACTRNWIPLTLYSLILLLLFVVAAIPAGLGLLVLMPVMAASVYTSYRDIFCAG